MILIGLLACGTPALAQFFPVSGGNYTGCGGVFTDSGLLTGGYGPNESHTITICPDGSSGTHARLLFAGVEVPYGDELCFFDGTDTQAPSLACAGDFLPGAPFIIQATAANASGCITVTFTSDGFKQGKGWTAALSCVPACQAFESSILLSQPEALPTDTGWIDLCPGQSIDLSGGVTFLQNGLFYNQSESKCTFQWDFGDGTIKQGVEASHIYQKPGGYLATLTITDQFGCRSRNFTTRRVRVAPPAQWAISGLPAPLCPGDTLSLLADTIPGSAAQIHVAAVEGQFTLSRMRADSLPLPDGNGALYETSVFFSEFPPDRVLNDPSEILSICANMEHSWMRDLRIELTCPSGQKVVLVNQEEAGEEVFLGQPFENDELLPVPIPGKGFTYCWDAGAPNGTWLQYANANQPQTLPAGTYDSFEPLSGLIGCPLNGEWVLSVQDLWEIDNGYIFWWNIQFDETLIEKVERFRAPITELRWEPRPNVISTQGGELSAVADRSGEIFFRLFHKDAFGCEGDTFITLPVLSPTHPNCLSCTTIASLDTSLCLGDSLVLEASFEGFQGGPVTFSAYPMQPIGYANHPPATPYAAPLAVANLKPDQITNAQASIRSVCFDLKTNPVNNIAVFLESPDGRQLELTTYNGGLGLDYQSTCFSPEATLSIKSGSAPFTGDFIPEGLWSALDSAQLNGTWHLLVSDNFGINREGLLESWSITFETENQVTYTWSPVDRVDCPDCPSTSVDTDSSGTFQVTVADLYGCAETRNIKVVAEPGFPAPNVTCGASTASHLAIQWEAVPGALGYEINIGGTGWIPVNGNLQHLIAGLSQGDTVAVQLRVAASSLSCPPGIAELACRYLYCQLEVLAQNTVSPSCHGASDGIAFISALKGKAPFQYRLDDQVNAPIGFFNSLAAGPHQVVVTDAMGCKDTTFFTLDQPEPIEITLEIDSALCHGSATGSIEASASGGAGGLTFDWQGQTGNGSPTLSLIPAGVYSLRVEDQNGCFRDTTATVSEPAPMVIAFDIDSVRCAGEKDGAVNVTISGGAAPYTLLWSTGSKSEQITGLTAGAYGLTVTDASGCTRVDTALVSEASPYVIQSLAEAPSCTGGDNGKAWLTFEPADPSISITWAGVSQLSGDTAILLSAGVYQAIWKNGQGCTGNVSVTIPDAAPWTVSISTGDATCPESANGSATVEVASGGNPPFSYAWNDPQNQKASSAKALEPGIYQVTISDSAGCFDTRSATVGIEETMMLEPFSSPAPCATSLGGSATVTPAGGTPPFSFLWSDPTGKTDSVLTGVLPGPYQVTVTSAKGCQATAGLVIEALAGPQIDQITATPTRCPGGDDGQLIAKISGGTGPYAFKWSDPQEQSVNPAIGLEAGTYGLTLTDGAGCSVSSQAYVGTPTSFGVQIQSSVPPSCNGTPDGSLSLSASGGTSPLQLLWSNGQTGPTINGLAAGTYTVTVTDAQGCTGAFDISLTEAEDLILDILANDPSCPGKTDGRLEALVSGGLSPYKLSLDGSPFRESLVFERLAPGKHIITLRDQLGCTREDTIELLAALPFTIDAGPDVSIESGGSIQLSVSHDAPQEPNYFWNAPYGGTLSCETCPTPIAHPLFSVTYLVEATDLRGCRASDAITVFVQTDRTILVPTAFSPNGDGENDLLLVHGSEGIQILEFRVYDRWGELLYQDRDFPINETSRGWNGSFRGKEMGPGVYIWNLEAEFPDGLRLPFQGQTTLIR